MRPEPADAVLSALGLAHASRFAEIRDPFTPQLQGLVHAETLETAWKPSSGSGVEPG